jgi:two-component system sensor kinase FixL
MPFEDPSYVSTAKTSRPVEPGALPSLIEALPDHAIVRLDASGQVNGWGAAADHLFGWSAAEIRGHRVDRLLAPGAATILLDRLAPGSGASRVTCADQCRRKDGSSFRAIASLSTIEGEGGTTDGFWLVVRDVTAERASASSIEASAILLNSILETVPDAMIVIDEIGRAHV